MENSKIKVEKKEPGKFDKFKAGLKSGADYVIKTIIEQVSARLPKMRKALARFKNKEGYKGMLALWQKYRKYFTKRKILIVIVIIIAALLNHYRPWSKINIQSQAVTTSDVIKNTVPVYMDYVGTTESVRSVDIRARVEGFLVSRTFVEGDDVDEGALMFEIDPREFEAVAANSRAQLKKDEAALSFALEEVKRYETLVEKEYVTRQFFDEKVTAAEEAEAVVKADQATLEQSELNLSYCKMFSPVSGRVGRTFFHVGNLVGAVGQDTRLATVVQLDPIYVYFSPSEQDYRTIAKYKKDKALQVTLKFDDGSAYPQKGEVDFVNNEVDSATSTVKMRAVIPNPDKVLLPGIYVNVHLLITEAEGTLLIPQQAVSEDQGGEYVLVVDEDGKVDEKRIETGAAYNNMRVVNKGVEVGEKIIIDGTQLVRPGMKVEAKFIPNKELEEKLNKTKGE